MIPLSVKTAFFFYEFWTRSAKGNGAQSIVALAVALQVDRLKVIMGEMMALKSHKTIENIRLYG